MKTLIIYLIMVGLALSPHASSAESTKRKKEIVVKNFSTETVWKTIQKKSETGIVQIIAHIAQADPLKPYYKQSGEGRGSGALIAGGNGLILTSYHVIENAVKVGIQMPLYFGKRMLEASVVGVCPDYDIALLQLDPAVCSYISKQYGQIPTLPLGNSDLVDRSDQLLGLGFPLGEESLKSVTGIVSGYEHVMAHNGLRVHSSYAIQVSTPLNPGSSGGPVLNAEGEVVGMSMAGNTEAQNVGFVVPINYYKILEEQLKKGGLVRKPTLGATFCRAKDNELALVLGNPIPAGCYLTYVFEGGLAAAMGIKEGDMVYTINGFVVDPYGCIQSGSSRDRLYVSDYLASLPLGHSLEIELYRKGQKMVMRGELSLTAEPAVRWRYCPYDMPDYEIIGGLLIQELSLNIIALFEHSQLGNEMPNVRSRLSLYKEETLRDTPVLVVTHVFPSSVAYSARAIGLGSFITHVNDQEVTSLAQLREALRTTTQKEFVVFKTDEKELLALPVSVSVQDESRLSQSFGYPSTPAMRELIERQASK